MDVNNINDNSDEENLKNSENIPVPEDNKENDLTSEEETGSKFQEFFSETIETQKPKVTDTLIKFLELKEIDEELAEIDEEKGDLPESIEAIIEKIAMNEKELNEKSKSIEIIEEEKSKLEKDNSSHEEKINKYDEQKFNVRSNKEYDEIVKTIESLFEEVKKNEERIKEIDEISGMLKTDNDIIENKLNGLKTELSEKQTTLDELNEQYKQDEIVLKEKRNSLISKLDEQSASLYERINNLYRGEATGIVRKGNCLGCYNSIPPQRVIEIKAAEKIFTCQSCGRILIPEELQTIN
jgi:predicted  nucleic acid-binding Zn-ribbon protein